MQQNNTKKYIFGSKKLSSIADRGKSYINNRPSEIMKSRFDTQKQHNTSIYSKFRVMIHTDRSSFSAWQKNTSELARKEPNP